VKVTCEGELIMLSNALEPEETSIAVWGPTNSGKDWLFRGFAKELEFYNSRYDDFLFDLYEDTEDGPRPVLAAPPHDIAPTSREKDYVYHFRRKVLKQDEAHLLSSHLHKINFHNNAGENLLGATISQSRYESAVIPILRSKYLLIVLDGARSTPDANTTDNENNLDRDQLDIAKRPGLGKEDYLRVLTMLMQLLSDSSMTDRQLAICMTKMDTTGLGGSNPWSQLEIVFGQRIHKLISRFRTTFNIEVFATSAAGYYFDSNGIRKSNFDGGQIADIDNWNPVNCAAPFFWIFQTMEIEKIRISSNFFNRDYNLGKYLKYPPRRNIS